MLLVAHVPVVAVVRVGMISDGPLQLGARWLTREQLMTGSALDVKGARRAVLVEIGLEGEGRG